MMKVRMAVMCSNISKHVFILLINYVKYVLFNQGILGLWTPVF